MDEITRHIAQKGLSQSEFASTLGVTNSTFHNWKNGRCAPDTSTQHRIAALLSGKTPQDVPAASQKAPALPKSRQERPAPPTEALNEARDKAAAHKAAQIEQRNALVQQGMQQIDAVGEALAQAKTQLAAVRTSLKSVAKTR
jgi:DNA-binding XRE family transcriptional regulator